MMQSVTRRKRLSYTRRWCIVIATSFTSVYPRRAFKHHEHRGRVVLFLRAFSPRETAALSAGLIPAVQATPSLSLHLLPAGVRTFRCDRHARRNVEKPGSIRAPLALPRLVNILHAVGADCVLRKGPVGPVPCHHDVAVTITFERVAEETRRHTRRRKSDSIQHRLVYINSHIRLYIFSSEARLKRRLYREWEIYVRGAFRDGRIKYAIWERNLFFQITSGAMLEHYLALRSSFSRCNCLKLIFNVRMAK